MGVDSAPDQSTGTQDAIMNATFETVYEHGYADLTISKIAEEFPKSKSLLYYHYDDKDDLLVALLDRVLDQLFADISNIRLSDPVASLLDLFDRLVPTSNDVELQKRQTVLLELRAQAPRHDAYRRQFERADRVIRERIQSCLRNGISQGVFREVDVPMATQLLAAMYRGAMVTRAMTDNTTNIDQLRRGLIDFIGFYLLGTPSKSTTESS